MSPHRQHAVFDGGIHGIFANDRLGHWSRDFFPLRIGHVLDKRIEGIRFATHRIYAAE